jgi:hypothetical protein
MGKVAGVGHKGNCAWGVLASRRRAQHFRKLRPRVRLLMRLLMLLLECACACVVERAALARVSR